MATVRSVAKKLRDAMSHEAGKAAAPLMTTTMPGTVVAIDGKGNATVDVGNGQTTHAALGTGAHVGNHVAVEFGNMTATVVRNMTDPPDNQIARDAADVADEAAAVANATGQHFWDDGNGVHVADEEREDWDEEWAKSGHGSIGTPTSQRPWHNILINSLGLLLRTGIMNLVGITRSAIAFYDGTGNVTANIVAKFGTAGAQIGKLAGFHIGIDTDSVDIMDGTAKLGTFGANELTLSPTEAVSGGYTRSSSIQITPRLTKMLHKYGPTGGASSKSQFSTGFDDFGPYCEMRTVNANGKGFAVEVEPELFDVSVVTNDNTLTSLLQARQTGPADFESDILCGTVNGVDVSDSGWKTLPLASGWKAYNAAQTPRYRRVCGLVQVVGAVKPTADTTVGSTAVSVGNIPSSPSGFRPSQRMVTLNPASGSNRVTVSVETNGSVMVGRYGTGSGYVTVTPSHWVPIGIMYLA